MATTRSSVLCCTAVAFLLLGSTAVSGQRWCWKPAAFNRTTLTDPRLASVSSEGILFLDHPASNNSSTFPPVVLNDGGAFVKATVGGPGNPAPNMKFEKQAAAKPGGWLPSNLRAMGYRHVGDTDYSQKLQSILAPVSGWPKPLVGPAFIGVDSVTLEAIPDHFECIVNTSQVGQVFTPWVAVNGDYFMSGDFNLAQVIYVYRIVPNNSTGTSTKKGNGYTCAFDRVIPLSKALPDTQGGIMFNDTTLLVASDDECIYSIDLVTGKVDTSYCFSSDIKKFEMEGLALQDLTSLSMGRLHVQAGSFGRPYKTRHIFHLDYVC